MAIQFQILGEPGRDNAALVTINTGQAVHRLLFDCGDGCLSSLAVSEIYAIDHLCFSHFHMDHISGFDSFFRCNYGRVDRPNRIWGPSNTSSVMAHRLQGFWWNLTEGLPGTWRLHDILEDRVDTVRLENAEHFAVVHAEESNPCRTEIFSNVDYSIEAILLNHKGPTVAYQVKEKARTNLDTSRLAELGMNPGPWIKELKNATGSDQIITVDGENYRCGELRDKLLVETPGDSIAYVTDFLLDAATHELLSQWLQGCDTLICEAQYRHADLELAHKHFHATTTLVANLASSAQIGQLVLFHLSDRYSQDEWKEMLVEARQVFPNTSFPDSWKL